MKKKICIIISVILGVIIILGIITNYADSARVATGHEPKYCIKLVSNDGAKVTYWGLGYKVIRYVGASSNEPYESNIGSKMGNWFMKYELLESKIIEIEYEGQTILITDTKDVGTIENILVNSRYNSEICDGINTHKITLDNDVYYIKESCKEVQRGDKQAAISKEDLETINSIIAKKISREKKNYSKTIDGTTIELNIPSEWKYEDVTEEEKENCKFALKLYKKEPDKNVELHFYNTGFGVCGTGRITKIIKLDNGKQATVGYYDGGKEWSDISFFDINPKIAFINNGLKEEADEVLEFVKTIDIF